LFLKKTFPPLLPLLRLFSFTLASHFIRPDAWRTVGHGTGKDAVGSEGSAVENLQQVEVQAE
jgi:hypothetical protein